MVRITFNITQEDLVNLPKELQVCLQNPKLLTDWEKAFIGKIRKRNLQTLSDRQKAALWALARDLRWRTRGQPLRAKGRPRIWLMGRPYRRRASSPPSPDASA